MSKLFQPHHLQEYENIFKTDKMLWLWQEFTADSAEKWKKLPQMNDEQVRLALHCWKSSSLIFGMDEFARGCGVLENKLLKHQPAADLAEPLQQLKQCYAASTTLVTAYFNQYQGKADER